MERIKKALDLARQEREALKESPMQADAPVRNARSGETHIVYSQTRVQRSSLSTLQDQRVLATQGDPDGLAAFKILRTQVVQRMTGKGWNTLAITSPAAGDGKTLVAANLAVSMARELDHTVLLADLDLRNPSLHRYFGLDVKAGIGDYLLGEASLADVLINPGIERLVLLPGRMPISDSSEMLASPRMRDLVKELKLRYPSRFVLFDLPPVLAADDALSFAPNVDATLLVLRERKNTAQELELALETLRDVSVLGTVLNSSKERISSYY